MRNSLLIDFIAFEKNPKGLLLQNDRKWNKNLILCRYFDKHNRDNDN